MFWEKFPYSLIWSRDELCINKIIIDGCGTSRTITMRGYDSTREGSKEGTKGLSIYINPSHFILKFTTFAI